MLLIEHNSNFRIIWDIIVIVLVIYNGFLLPVQIAFDIENEVMEGIDYAVDAVFYLDICFNFITTIDTKEDDQTKKKKGCRVYKKIAIHYMKTWFIIDLLASLPLDLIIGAFTESDFGWIKGLKTLRIFRLSRLLNMLSKFQKVAQFIRMMELFFFFFLFCHWFACIWFIIGRQTDDGWLVTSVPNYEYESTSHLYTLCLYWVTVTFLTVGYGDISVITYWERFFAMSTMIMGAMVYAVIFGNINILLESLGRSDRVYSDKMDAINFYMSDLGLPENMQKRVRGYYQYLWDRHKTFQESDTLKELPARLSTEIAEYLHKEIFDQCIIWKEADQLLLREVATKLRCNVSLESEFILREGENADKIFFVRKGEVKVETVEHGHLTNLDEGAYFGEIGLVLRDTDGITRRTASCISSTNCDLYFMTAEGLEMIFRSFDAYRTMLVELARIRLEQTQPHNDMALLHKNFVRLVQQKVIIIKSGSSVKKELKEVITYNLQKFSGPLEGEEEEFSSSESETTSSSSGDSDTTTDDDSTDESDSDDYEDSEDSHNSSGDNEGDRFFGEPSENDSDSKDGDTVEMTNVKVHTEEKREDTTTSGSDLS